ncbi:MAG: NAD(P)H-binding protein [Streptosporangiaceae bacterium]|jgi:nucleoside-diphosphate-sugar epimerase
MRIAIAGGTGTLGRHVVDELRERGHDVRALSRRSLDFPVDLTTGAGLAEALEGCEVVVDAANASSGKRSSATLVAGSRRLLAAEQKAGVKHHVCVSIVGCDKVPMGYYAVKVQQERVVAGGCCRCPAPGSSRSPRRRWRRQSRTLPAAMRGWAGSTWPGPRSTICGS